MSAKVEQQTAAAIAEIKTKLSMIEDYMVWLIRADQHLSVGQRVEWSRRARERGYPKRKSASRGVVKAITSFGVVVLLDGYKQPHSYNHAFFNPVSGPKLF